MMKMHPTTMRAKLAPGLQICEAEKMPTPGSFDPAEVFEGVEKAVAKAL